MNLANGPGRYIVFKEKLQEEICGVLFEKTKKTWSGYSLV